MNDIFPLNQWLDLSRPTSRDDRTKCEQLLRQTPRNGGAVSIDCGAPSSSTMHGSGYDRTRIHYPTLHEPQDGGAPASADRRANVIDRDHNAAANIYWYPEERENRAGNGPNAWTREIRRLLRCARAKREYSQMKSNNSGKFLRAPRWRT